VHPGIPAGSVREDGLRRLGLRGPETSHRAGRVGPGVASQGFPVVIRRAMAALRFLPPGTPAPTVVPADGAGLRAQVSALGGSATVTLGTPTGPSGAGRELASYTVTPAGSAGAAAAALASLRRTTLTSCEQPGQVVPIGAGRTAVACPAALGPVVTWQVGSWTLQVQALGGATPPLGPAGELASWIRAAGLPRAPSGGLVSEVVPGSPAAGPAPTILLAWQVGTELAEVRSLADPKAAVELAASMAPYPGTGG